MKKLLPLLFVASLFALPGCGMVTVHTGEVGVKNNMGVLEKNLLKPGFSMYNPFLQGVETYNIKQQIESDEVTPLTADQQPLTIKYKVQYSIPETQVYTLAATVSGKPFEVLIDPQISESFRQIVSQYKADKVATDITTIKNQVVARARKNLGNRVVITDIPITQVDFPAQLQEAILQKQKVEIEFQKKKYELERELKQAEITRAQADAEAFAIQKKAAALKASPQLVELEKVRKWNGVLPQTVLGGSGSTMFNLK